MNRIYTSKQIKHFGGRELRNGHITFFDDIENGKIIRQGKEIYYKEADVLIVIGVLPNSNLCLVRDSRKSDKESWSEYEAKLELLTSTSPYGEG